MEALQLKAEGGEEIKTHSSYIRISRIECSAVLALDVQLLICLFANVHLIIYILSHVNQIIMLLTVEELPSDLSNKS